MLTQCNDHLPVAGEKSCNLPDGLTSPNRIDANALPASVPLYQASTIAGTCFTPGHSNSIARYDNNYGVGFAFANSAISWSCSGKLSELPVVAFAVLTIILVLNHPQKETTSGIFGSISPHHFVMHRRQFPFYQALLLLTHLCSFTAGDAYPGE